MPEKADLNELKIHSVKFNVVMNMILTSSAFIFPLITVPYVSRVLSTFGTGSVAFAQSIISYFSLIALLGLPVYGVRECARVRDNRQQLSQTVKELMTILMISSGVVYGVFLIVLFTVPRIRSDVPLMLICSSAIWLASCGVEWFYQAIEQYGYITIRNIVMKFLGLVLMLTFVHSVSDYRIYGAIVVIASYGSNILNLFRLRKFISFSDTGKLNLIRHLRPMAAFTVSSVSSGMYTQVDLVLVGFLGTTNMVGLYQLVVKVKNLCVAAVNSVGNVMLPRLSYYEAKGAGNKTKNLMSKNLNFLTIASLAIISILILCSDSIILILGGKAFAPSAVALELISPALLFSSANGILSQYMVAHKQEKIYAIINFVGLIVAILYCSILIPRFGIDGGAIGISACELTVLVIRFFVLHNFMHEISHLLDTWKIFLSSIISFCLSFYASKFLYFPGNLTYLISISMIFLIFYLILLLILKESFIFSIFRHRKKFHSR